MRRMKKSDTTTCVTLKKLKNYKHFYTIENLKLRNGAKPY